MFLLEKTYDIDELMQNNMHTHSTFSLCSKPEMNLADMIKAAENYGIKTLAVTDHSDPESDIDVKKNTGILKVQLKEIQTDVRVLIGSELSAYGVGKFADDDELNACLDYRSYSCVHYHLEPWEHPEDRSPYGYSRHMLKVAESLIDSGRADNFAHPFSPGKMKFFNEEEKKEMLRCLTDNDLGYIMEKAEKNAVSWELHSGTICSFPEYGKRFFNIGKEVGVHFTVGTDAHRLQHISTKDFCQRFKEIIAD